MSQPYANNRQIQDLKLVSKSWYDTISHSKAVHRARLISCEECYDPWQDLWPEVTEQNIRDAGNAEVMDTIGDILHLNRFTIPAYLETHKPRLNPAIAKVHLNKYTDCGNMEEPGTRVDVAELMIRLPTSMSSIDPKALDEYVSEPPCRVMALQGLILADSDGSWSIPGTSSSPCWAYSRDGLRFRDIVAVQDQVSATRGPVEDEEQRGRIVNVASLTVRSTASRA